MTAAEIRERLNSSIPWQDKSLLILEFHQEKLDSYGQPEMGAKSKSGWSLRDTADALKISLATVSYDLRLGRELLAPNSPLRLIKSKNQAIAYLNRQGMTRVELKYARTFVSGTLVEVIKHNAIDHYVIKLDKPLKTEPIDIETLFLPFYHCRLFRS